MYITLSNGDGSSLTFDYIEQSLGTSIRTIDSILHPGSTLSVVEVPSPTVMFCFWFFFPLLAFALAPHSHRKRSLPIADCIHIQ